MVYAQSKKHNYHIDPISELVAGTAAATGEQFFTEFVRHLAILLHAEFAIVTEKIADNPVVKVRTLAFWRNGQAAENYEYDVTTTPCEQVYKNGFCYFPANIQQIFYEDRELVDMGVHSYMGMPLVDAEQKQIGHICVLGSKPVAEAFFSKPYFKIFAARASAELQRLNAEKALRQYQGHLEELVAERTLNLLKEKEKAELASRAKSEFLSRMSHELRTPLNAVLGYAQFLESDEVDPLCEAHKEPVRYIVDAGWHLLNLINDVLDLSKIEAGKLKLELANISLFESIHSAVTMISTAASERHIEIINNIGFENDLEVIADQRRLAQILVNLLSNAVKYNRDGGKIILNSKIDESENTIRIEVTDTGHGVPPDYCAKIFEKFERVECGKPTTEGTGIGLCISKSLVEIMGGEIGVQSTLGEGSTFWFYLDKACQA